MSITNLGKRDYNILRADGKVVYVDGEPVAPLPRVVVVRANIQPSTFSYRTQLLDSGDRDKEALNIYSNDWLYTSRKGNGTCSDVVLYRGAQWEVVVSKPYGNFGQHCESLALKLDEEATYSLDGIVGLIK